MLVKTETLIYLHWRDTLPHRLVLSALDSYCTKVLSRQRPNYQPDRLEQSFTGVSYIDNNIIIIYGSLRRNIRLACNGASHTHSGTNDKHE